MNPHTDRQITIDATPYLVHPEGEDVRVGQRGPNGGLRWLPETLPTDMVDMDDDVELESLVRAIVNRGA